MVLQYGSHWISDDSALDHSCNIIFLDEHHGLATAELLEKAALKTSNGLDVDIGSIVTDASGQFQRAKRILALSGSFCFTLAAALMIIYFFEIFNLEIVETTKKLVSGFCKCLWLRYPVNKKINASGPGYSTQLLESAGFRPMLHHAPDT